MSEVEDPLSTNLPISGRNLPYTEQTSRVVTLREVSEYGLPYAEFYGLLYCRNGPDPLDELVAHALGLPEPKYK